ncbi:MAG: SDR family oxidoreductase [Candidatus Latescibacterota bacterium]|jgi:short-subunit dehydrogenase
MLAGKVAVLTGASSGLGAALALALAEAGATLALFATNSERLEGVAAQCRERGAKVLAVTGDVTKAEDCQRLMQGAVSELGRIDYMIANAGISMWARFEELEEVEVFQRLIDVNYMGVVRCAHAALPHLKERAGMVVVISSIQSKVPVPLHSGYVASKHAVQGFCDVLRLELQGTGVDVLTVLPHWLRGTNLRQSALGGDGQALGETSRKHSSESITVEDASVEIIRAMKKRQRQLVMPWKLKLLAAVYALKPQWAEAVIGRAMNKQNDDE